MAYISRLCKSFDDGITKKGNFDGLCKWLVDPQLPKKEGAQYGVGNDLLKKEILMDPQLPKKEIVWYGVGSDLPKKENVNWLDCRLHGWEWID